MRARAARLVGRAAEWETLRAARAGARAGDGSVVLVTGDAGIGKTRLIEELSAVAAADGWRAGVGACAPVVGTRLPYAPVVDLIGELRRGRPDLAAEVPPEIRRSIGMLTGDVPGPAGGDVAV